MTTPPRESSPQRRLRAGLARAGQSMFKMAACALARLRGFGPDEPAYQSWPRRAWEDYLRARDRHGRLDPTQISCPNAEPNMISIVLPVYNGERYLREAIDSVLMQIYGQWELIIVDDGSTDLSAEIAEEFAARDTRIKLLRQENHKLPAALNAGFAQARGEFLTWTSDDNRLKPVFLEKLATALRARPSVDMIYANYEIIDEHGAILKNSTWCAELQQPPGSGRVHVFRDASALNLINGNFIGPAFMFRARTMLLVGNFSPHWFTCEDYDFAMRVNEELDLRPAHFMDCIYEYRLHGAALSADNQSSRKQMSGRLLVWDDFRRGLIHTTKAENILRTDMLIARQQLAREWEEASVASEKSAFALRASIIICTRRKPEFLAPLLKALQEQTSRGWELIIVDNRTDSHLDDTEFQDFFKKECSEMSAKIIRAGRAGLAHARNMGLRAACGEIVTFLDDDTIPDSHWLENTLHEFATHPECAIIGGAIEVRDPMPAPWWWRPHARRCWSEYRSRTNEFYTVENWKEFPHGGNWSARRSALLQIGGFREQFGHHGNQTGAGEEILAALLIQRIGGKIGIAPQARVTHCISSDRFTLRQLWRNMLAGWRVRLRLESGLYIERATSPLGQIKDALLYFLDAIFKPRLNHFQRLERLMWSGISLVLLKDFLLMQLNRLRRRHDSE